MNSISNFVEDVSEEKKRRAQPLRDKHTLYYFYPLRYHLIKQFWKLSSGP